VTKLQGPLYRSVWSSHKRKSVQHPTCGPTMAKQEFKKECDINEIIKRFRDTGVIEHVKNIQGTFGDFTNAMDYQSSLNKVLEAQAEFNQLPAKVRGRFQNDPAKLVAFVNDPKNRREAAYLGLLNKEATQRVVDTDKKVRAARQDAKDKKIAELQAKLAQQGNVPTK